MEEKEHRCAGGRNVCGCSRELDLQPAGGNPRGCPIARRISRTNRKARNLSDLRGATTEYLAVHAGNATSSTRHMFHKLKCRSLADAHLQRSRLLEEGIESSVVNENTSLLFSDSMMPPHLLVADEDWDRAQALLNETPVPLDDSFALPEDDAILPADSHCSSASSLPASLHTWRRRHTTEIAPMSFYRISSAICSWDALSYRSFILGGCGIDARVPCCICHGHSRFCITWRMSLCLRDS
jgi:hypothetical protein